MSFHSLEEIVFNLYQEAPQLAQFIRKVIYQDIKPQNAIHQLKYNVTLSLFQFWPPKNVMLPLRASSV